MSQSPKPALTRRTVFAGAGTAGALAAAAAILPAAKPVEQLAAAKPASAADGAAGYQATEHVLRYYATARV